MKNGKFIHGTYENQAFMKAERISLFILEKNKFGN